MEKMKVYKIMAELKPVLVMVIVQITYAGMNILYKLAVEDGMNLNILIAYRIIFATAFMLPLALLFERSRPDLTWKILFQAFLCGLFGGALTQNLYIEGLALTSATFAVAMCNLVPSMTFIIAFCFGLEKLGLRTAAGIAKVVGTVVGLGGAAVFTFCKGIEIDLWSTHIDLLHRGPGQISQTSILSHVDYTRRLLGCALFLGSSASYALWLIIQGKMNKKYPCYYSSTALMAMMGAIQSLVYALCAERDWKEWRLGFNIRLLAAAYSGIMPSGMMVALISWCIRARGPLFVSSFNPLSTLIVALASSFLLNEKLHLGSLLGGALIVCGLYIVLWGKSKEMMKKMVMIDNTKSLVRSSDREESASCKSVDAISDHGGAHSIEIIAPSSSSEVAVGQPDLTKSKNDIPDHSPLVST